jgi:hypothetical protein
MASLVDMREALATNLKAIKGAQWSAWRLSNATPPCGFVWVGPISYDTVMARGGDLLTLMVTVYVAFVNDIGAQQRFAPLLATTGPGSVKEAIEADPTLGGVCDDLRVTDFSGEQIYVLEGKGAALGGDFTVQVYT